ncbi:MULTISPECIES: hypothetical protein [Vibrio]|nr:MULTISPECIES: hypothetical protein [Vibrio]EGQ9414908.1 hypothetical protein [Vibrio cholerae]MCR9982835.1 hypothetical protein [Vibrio alginolyticus]EGQ7741025.1 hypothetical protein [Vibrio parahaemolyticus]EGQ9978735.1 hypothetical protein [Vibrio parahaemolyticus]EGR1766496.1 hypothetical protein [Vibrio parahaemolyticus]
MNKSELIDALKETGIVAKENDANGVRVLITLNDNESIKSKNEKGYWDLKLKQAQFWAVILTVVCLIISTTWGVFSQSTPEAQYIPRDGYVLKLTNGGKSKCMIPEVNENQTKMYTKLTGVEPCF